MILGAARVIKLFEIWRRWTVVAFCDRFNKGVTAWFLTYLETKYVLTTKTMFFHVLVVIWKMIWLNQSFIYLQKWYQWFIYLQNSRYVLYFPSFLDNPCNREAIYLGHEQKTGKKIRYGKFSRKTLGEIKVNNLLSKIFPHLEETKARFS